MYRGQETGLGQVHRGLELRDEAYRGVRAVGSRKACAQPGRFTPVHEEDGDR